MVFLTYAGLPPSMSLALMVWMGQVKMAWTLVSLRYLIEKERREYLMLPPSEQYRRHLAAGGYRP